MQRDRLGDDVGDRHARIERRVRVLKHELRLAAEGARLRVVEREHVLTVEAHAARGRLDQPQHEAADGRLAGAGLADQRQRLAGLDREAHAVDRVHMRGRAAEHGTARDEVLHQPFGFDQRGHATSCSSGARRQRDQRPPRSTTGGGAARQSSSTNGQRAAKRHPIGGSVMSGSTPSIAASFSAR